MLPGFHKREVRNVFDEFWKKEKKEKPLNILNDNLTNVRHALKKYVHILVIWMLLSKILNCSTLHFLSNSKRDT